MENNLQHTKSDCLRIVLYGPESTGKTTLARDLAAYYSAEWVPEFARDFLQKKWDKHREECTLEDLITIAKGQLAAENAAALKTNEILICDTNILVTKVWSETHFEGYCDPEIESILAVTNYDLYILTDIDVPWEKDDLRDRPNDRQPMADYFKKQLTQYNLPFIAVSGRPAERLKKAVFHIDQLLAVK